MPVIVIEIVLVLGGTLAFAWWQLRDLARERRKREEAARRAVSPDPVEAAPRDTGDR